MLRIGVEGPILAGKTSLISGIESALAGEAIVVSCFVDFASQSGVVIPPGLTASRDEQISSLEDFGRLDRDRQKAGTGAHRLMILDRTAITLVAHSYAVRAVGGPDVVFEAERMLKEAAKEGRLPDICFVLSPSFETQLKRSASRTEIPFPFLDREFNAAFTDYLADAMSTSKLGVQYFELDAELGRDANIKNVLQIVDAIIGEL